MKVRNETRKLRGVTRRGALALALLAAGSTTVALGAETSDVAGKPGFYVAGSLAGASRNSAGNEGVTGRLNAGWRFSEHFAAEVGYARPVDGAWDTQLIDGGEIALRGELPVSQRVSAFARAGVFKWDQQGAFADEGTDFTGGVGMRVAMNQRLSFTGSFDYYDGVGYFGDDGTEQLNLGVQLDF